MSFEQILVKFLYSHKTVTLEGIGTITINGTIPDADFINKNKNIPVEGVEFSYNSHAVTDEAFIDFFAKERKKIKPLALSDIESQLSLAKQLLNIGNPFEIYGIGYIVKQSSGNYILNPGYYINIDTLSGNESTTLKERVDLTEKKSILEEPMLNSKNNKRVNSKGLILTLLVIIILAGLVWVAWPFITNKLGGIQQLPPQTEVIPDSPTQSTVDSQQKVNTPVPVNNNDTNSVYNWKAIFRSVNGKEEAVKRQKLYSANSSVKLETADSVNFIFYAEVAGKYSDTNRIKDSVKKFFARPVTLQKIQ
ncbi:hypothetical protein [Polluticaenibacter yanchengensis]|uniref:CCDC81-like prokaryotic HU domain-containing protein n=1 Tax=Polluticaenibacter yanchengensis TaxID=3014562 RepID=A0ABT4UKW3_9BACT|nr:hypothetical protein [Chitinophagaceae bacterium LY-5]